MRKVNNFIRIKKISEGLSWFTFNNSGLVLGINLKFYSSMKKGLKLKDSEF